MKQRRCILEGLVLVAFLILMVSAGSCSDSSDPIQVGGGNDDQAAGGDGESAEGGGTGGGDGTDDGSGGDGSGGPDGDGGPTDGDEGPDEGAGPPIDPECSSGEDACCDKDSDCLNGNCYKGKGKGVCIIEPISEATVWWEDSYYDADEGNKVGRYDQLHDENGDPAKPDFSCHGNYSDTTGGETITVDVTLIVFGVKSSCQVLRVETFRMLDDQGNMKTEFPGEDILTQKAVTDLPDEEGKCHLTLDNVPLGKWLVFKSTDDDAQLKDTYQWNVYIKSDEKEKGNKPYYLEVNAIAKASWDLVPITAGVAGVKAGNGTVAGTIKDCQGRLVKEATVGITILPTKLTYFDAHVEDLLPTPSLSASNADSTFSAIDQPAGPVLMMALAKVNGEIVIVGEFPVVVIENSVAIYSLHGAGPMNYGLFQGPD